MSAGQDAFRQLADLCLLRATPPLTPASRKPSEASQVRRPELQRLLHALGGPRLKAVGAHDPKSRLKVQNGRSGVKDPERGFSHAIAPFTKQGRGFFGGFGLTKNRRFDLSGSGHPSRGTPDPARIWPRGVKFALA